MYRTIETGTWDDDEVRKLSPIGKLLWVYLFTNRHSHVSGIYYIPDVTICYELAIKNTVLDTLWDTLSGARLAWRDNEKQVVFVRSMLRYQGRGDKNLRAAAAQLRTLHNCPLINNFLEEYPAVKKYGIDRVSIGHPDLAGVGIQEQDQEQDQEQEPPIGPPKGAGARRATKATPVPDSFPITDDLKEWATKETPGLNVEAETKNFLDHHRSKGNCFKDWPAAWRKWMRNAAEWGHARNNARGGAAEDEAKLERARAIHDKLQKPSKTGGEANGSVSMAAKPG